MDYYYWLDTDYFYGDFSVPKFALFRGEYDEDGKEDRSTEEVVFWDEYSEYEVYDEDGQVDIEATDKAIDEAIFKELGFLPDYDIN